jgi:hypothetical protein
MGLFDKTWARIFGGGLLATLLIAGAVVFLKRGERLVPQGSVLKERSIDLNEATGLLLLDIRLVNDSDVVMTIGKIGMTAQMPDGGQFTGRILRKSDLMGTFNYFPLLGEKFNAALSYDDEIPPRSKVDRMIAASFEAPLSVLDTRKQITVRIEDRTGTAAEFTGK